MQEEAQTQALPWLNPEGPRSYAGSNNPRPAKDRATDLCLNVQKNTDLCLLLEKLNET
jgi:hypothetical protein